MYIYVHTHTHTHIYIYSPLKIRMYLMKYPQKYGRQGNSTTLCSDSATRTK